MLGLELAFNVLSLCGVWLPMSWRERHRLRALYGLFTLGIVVVTGALIALQCALLATSELSMSFLAEILFTLLTSFSVCFKSVNFLARRERIILLAGMLLRRNCLPRNAREIEMEERTTSFLRIFTIYFNVLAQVTLALLFVMPLVQAPEKRTLPFRIWLPYDVRCHPDSCANYWTTYAIQSGPMIGGILINVTTDVIVSGFVLQACTQLDILKYRMSQLPRTVKKAREMKFVSAEGLRSYERKALQQFFQHHDYIIKYAKVVTETFDVIIVEQFIAGALNFSVIIYVLTVGQVPTIQKLMSVTYLICMLGELFAYCWFGNRITIKSLDLSDDIYNIDWMDLSESSNKMLIFMMMRTTRPIIMSYGNLVILNVDSFKSILKVTYTAFNVLKESTTLDG